MSSPKLPEALEKIVDKVLAYKPKPKSKAAKKRKKAAKGALRSTSAKTSASPDMLPKAPR
jgi:hypothetical protein